ncbi:hypothetical protein ANO14919_046330 [Xylariales sp. No.14919]|nr:hypothetical protein ANO14919_046330 [Xylariales sp. No.14919]
MAILSVWVLNSDFSGSFLKPQKAKPTEQDIAEVSSQDAIESGWA